MKVDAQGNIWIASYGNASVCVFFGGNPLNSQCYQEPTGSKPFDIQIATDGSIWVSNSGGFGQSSGVKSSIAKFNLNGKTIQQSFVKTLGSSLKGISLDSNNNAWIASGDNNKVYALNSNGRLLGVCRTFHF